MGKVKLYKPNLLYELSTKGKLCYNWDGEADYKTYLSWVVSLRYTRQRNDDIYSHIWRSDHEFFKEHV